MQEKQRQRVTEALSTARQVVLSAGGPAQIQAEVLACEAIGLILYVLVPRTSDLLFNLEIGTLVVATADIWQGRGAARLLPTGEYPNGLTIACTPQAQWCELIEIQPTQMILQKRPGLIRGETIDIW
ncbi:MAG: hypothetical protein Q7O66_22215 [Dehalococcoidia bacterium]|nr:hypothetical protein [Dehalococcoidia bacterium]